MANVLLNGLASTAGGGITYLRNVLPRLSRYGDSTRYFMLVPKEHLQIYLEIAPDPVRIDSVKIGGGSIGRLLWEQTGLRHYIKSQKIDLIVSLGNFALLGSPVPQILFNRNDLYFSESFNKELKSRRAYRALAAHLLKRRLSHKSIKQATINISPTKAFADRILASPGLRNCRFEVLPFGFDSRTFTSDDKRLPAEQLSRLNFNNKCRRLLYVGHYNYYRNFETLIRALPLIKAGISKKDGGNIQLVLTTDIRRGSIHGGYDATLAAKLIDRLGLQDDIAMLGSVPYGQLHHFYRQCDAFVCPSYAESFGHPLLEAMAMGLPVIASNLAVHREVCGSGAVYFDVFDERMLAEQCVRVLSCEDLKRSLQAEGLKRSRHFTWDQHTRGLVALIERTLSSQTK